MSKIEREGNLSPVVIINLLVRVNNPSDPQVYLMDEHFVFMAQHHYCAADDTIKKWKATSQFISP